MHKMLFLKKIGVKSIGEVVICDFQKEYFWMSEKLLDFMTFSRKIAG